MTILFLNPIGEIGGAERVLLAAIAGVRSEWPDATLRLIALGDGPLSAKAADCGADVAVVALPAGLAGAGDSDWQSRGWAALLWQLLRGGPSGAAFLRRLRARIRQAAPDLIHSNGIKSHLLTRLAAPSGVPVIWHAHDYYQSRPAAARLLRLASGRTCGVVAVSQSVAADVRRTLSVTSVEVVPNTVNLSVFHPAGAMDDLDDLAGLPAAAAGTLRIGLVATYARWKGQLTFLDAAAKLVRQSGPPLRFYLVGGPIYRTAAQFTEADLRRAAAERGLEGRVGFIPFQSEPAGVYRALDVVVHASTLPEPFGLTVAEAMACGRAVVVSAAGGVAELFTEGHDALGVPPGDPDRLAAAVSRLACGDELRLRLGNQARATAVSSPDQTAYGSRLAAFYGRHLAPNCRGR